MDLFRGISSPWCFSERSAVGVPYQNEISASSMKIVKLLSSSDVLKDTTCFERTKYKLFETDHYFSSGGRGGEINIVLHAKNLFFPFRSNKQFMWGFTYNLFRFIALANNSFQSFWFCKQFISTFSVPHPTCKQYIVYIQLALTARTFRMKFVCEMLPCCCIKA